jgi:hypothetical protein
MECTASSSAAGERIDLRRVWWGGPLTVAAALGANAVIRTVAVGVFAIPPLFHNLAWIHDPQEATASTR